MKRGRLDISAAQVFALLLCLLFILSACGKTAGAEKTGFAMGSVLTARIYAENEAEGADVAQEVLSAVNALDKRISATDPASEIFRLNETGSAELSREAYAFVQQAFLLSKATNGAADVTMGGVTALWGFSSEQPKKPDDREIPAALEAAGYQKAALNDGARTVTLSKGQRLDPGAFGKGAGCDEALRILKAHGCAGVITLGGTVLVYGEKPDSEAWTVGVRDPNGGADSCCGTLTLKTGGDTPAYFVSTSGSYEKTFTENGKTYHHILDPETGYPAQSGLVSVTAVSDCGCVSDAMSTALFIRGYTAETRTWIEEYLTGAVFIYGNGDVFATEGLENVFTLTDNAGYRMITAP